MNACQIVKRLTVFNNKLNSYLVQLWLYTVGVVARFEAALTRV